MPELSYFSISQLDHLAMIALLDLPLKAASFIDESLDWPSKAAQVIAT